MEYKSAARWRRLRHTMRLSIATASIAAVAMTSSIRADAVEPSDVPGASLDRVVSRALGGQGLAAESFESSDVQAPSDATDPVLLESGESTLAMGLPATGEATEVRDGIVAFNGTKSQVVVQTTESGARALIVLPSKRSPASHEFDFSGSAADLELQKDGSVYIFDADRELLGQIETPWATDAQGRDVPTSFAVDGLSLIQTIDHANGEYSYPITADPNFLWWAKNIAICVGSFALIWTPAAAAKLLKIKDMIKGSKKIAAGVKEAGGLKKVLIGIVDFVKSKGKHRGDGKVEKFLSSKLGKSAIVAILDLINGSCSNIGEELL